MKNKMNNMVSNKLRYLILMLACLWAFPAFAQQQVELLGTVTNAKTNEPIENVNITVRGTTAGTTTDVDGNYKLQVPSLQDTLVFSYIGYQSEVVPIDGRTTIDIEMKSKTIMGEELVVTGYGKVKKKFFTGSTSRITSEQLENVPMTNVKSMIGVLTTGARVSSLSGAPGGRRPVVIRGNTSISANLNASTAFSTPLYVIDGVQTSLSNLPGYYQSNQDFLASLNPDNIKSITILKGASAAAIYGSRGANGVIVIETKSGAALSEPKINFNFTLGFRPKPELVPIYVGAAERQRKMRMINTWWSYEDRLSSEVPIMLTDSLNSAFNNAVNYQGLFYRNAITQNYNISIRGGAEKNNYRVSAGYAKSLGAVISTGFKRYTLNARIDSEIGDKFTNNLIVRLSYSNRMTGQGNPYQTTYNYNSTLPTSPSDLNSSLFRLTDAQRKSLVGQLDNKLNKNRTISPTISDQIRYEFLDWLALSSQLTFKYRSNKKNYYEPSTLYDGVNGFASYSLYNHRSWSENTYLNMVKEWKDHELTILLGNRIDYNKSETMGLTAVGPGSDAIKVINDRYKTSQVDGFTGLSANATISFYTRIRYNFKDRYIFTVNYSRDGSSRFGELVRWANFPSVAGAWIFTSEPFIKQWLPDFIDYGKIRFSWGINGKQFSQDYIRYGGYTPGYGGAAHWSNHMEVSSYAGVKGVIPNYNSIQNRAVSWQQSTQWNIGVDLGLLNRRLSITFDAYHKKTSQLLFQVALPSYAGYNSAVANVAGVLNYGWEARVKYSIIPRTKDYQIRLSLGLSQNHNFVSKLPNGGRDYYGSNYGYVVGRPINLYYMFVNNGIVDDLSELPTNPYTGERLHGKPNGAWDYTRPGLPLWKDINGDNYLNSEGDQILTSEYSPSPTIRGSFNLNLNYKSWYLNLYSSFSFGADIYNSVLQNYLNHYDRGGDSWATNGLRSLKGISFWQKGDSEKEANYPALVPNAPGLSPFYSFRPWQTLWLENGSYWKINLVQLGYTFKNLDISPISNLRVFFTVKNPWMWKASDIIVNPALVNAKGRTIGNGYPPMTTYSLDVSVTF